MLATAQHFRYGGVNDVIADKNAVTKIMSKSTGLQHIGFNGFSDVIGRLVITPFLMVGV